MGQCSPENGDLNTMVDENNLSVLPSEFKGLNLASEDKMNIKINKHKNKFMMKTFLNDIKDLKSSVEVVNVIQLLY